MRRLLFFRLLKVTAAFLLLLYLQLLIYRPTRVYSKNSKTYSKLIKDDCVTRNYNYIATNKIYIEQETAYYQFQNNSNLMNYTLATGGKPLRNIIITTWRSGSKFLGDVLNAVPGSFYHYEPLIEFGMFQIRGPPFEDLAIKNIKRLLNCDYTYLNNYLDVCKKYDYFFRCNKRLWDMCKLYPMYCYDPNFLNNVCKLFPFQSMKIVRLRLRLAEQLLRDKSLNVRILLLVRDPRATLLSRTDRTWCSETPDCDQASFLCADMVSDYKAAVTLKKLYPSRFRVIRYEDFSIDPYKHVQELYDFFQLHFHPSVKAFVDSHTEFSFSEKYETFRSLKIKPFRWRSGLNFSEVQYIQENCDQAMQLWGYVKSINKTQLREFNPVTSYTIN